MTAWTEEEDRILADMAREGASGSEVGLRLGRSRNAIMGRAHRLGIRFHGPGSGNKNAAGKRRHVSPPPSGFAKRKQTEQTEKPKLRVITNEQRLIEDYIARHGVRRFEPTASGDVLRLSAYLEKHGYRVTCFSGHCRIARGDGPWRKATLREIIELADKFRVSEGLEPLVRRAG